MNDIQRQKAKAVLDYRDLPMFRSPEEQAKEKALYYHLRALQDIDKYNLPYRILYDIYKDNKACLNPCYPKPGYYKPDLIAVDWYIDKAKYEINPDIVIESGPFKDDLTSTKFDFRVLLKDGALKDKVEEQAAKQITWDLSTAAGLEQWKYYFAHFFNGAQLNSYNLFDWFGKKSAPNEEQEKKINFWKCLQADYYMNPDNYWNEEITDYNPKEYTSWKFKWADESESTQYSNSMM